MNSDGVRGPVRRAMCRGADDSFFANSNRVKAWRDNGDVEEQTDLRKALRSSSAAVSPFFGRLRALNRYLIGAIEVRNLASHIPLG